MKYLVELVSTMSLEADSEEQAKEIAKKSMNKKGIFFLTDIRVREESNSPSYAEEALEDAEKRKKARFKEGDRVVFVQDKSKATDTPPLYLHGTIKRISTYTRRGYQAYEVLWDNNDDDDDVYIMCDDELDFEEAFNKSVIKAFQQGVNKRLDKEDVSSHYEGDVEPVELMVAQFSPEAYMGFVRGNIIKYATRFGKKDTKLHEAKKIYEYAKYLLNYVRYLEEKQEEEKK